VTTLALYEDLLRPGEVRALAAASRILFVASGTASSLGPDEAWSGDADARLDAGREGATVLRWEVTDWEPDGAKAAERVELDPWSDYVMRCERVELAPGSSPATQAGPSVGCVLAGALRSEDEEGRGLSVLDAWSEGAHAGRTAASDLGATLVRVVLLPADSGPADGEQAIVLAEQRVRL